MHLRTLTVQAVGPFAGRHTVDFADLAASGLFLLEGPTGSGKSTLIDAVVFALYGKVASSEASDDRLRSAYASDDLPTVVDLTFEVGSGVYRVRRSPGYERAKRRGTGTTRQQPSVTLWRLSPDAPTSSGLDDVVQGEVLSTRLDEAGAELQRVVGLDRLQFVQTIVLPQGEFARFLRADPEDRRGLLQRIFGTQVYERLQQRLAELRREADQAVRAAREALAGTAAHFVGAARLSAAEGDGLRADVSAAAASGLVDQVRDRLRARLDMLHEDSARAQETVEQAQRAWTAAREGLDETLRVAGLRERRTALRGELATLRADEAAQRRVRERLEAARSAAGVRALLAGVDAAETGVDEAQAAVRTAFARAPQDVVGLPGVAAVTGLAAADGDAGARGVALADVPGPDEAPAVVPDPAATGAVITALGGVRDRALADAAALDRLVALEGRLDEGRRAVATARAAVATARQELAGYEDWLAGRPGERAELQRRVEQVGAVAGRAEALARDVTAAEEVCVRVTALGAARQELTAAEKRLEDAAAAAFDAANRESALRQAWIAGMAGELAEELTVGEPCPVCGSPEHPAPAARGEDHVSRKAVSAAEVERRVREQALQEARDDAVRLGQRVESLVEQVGDLTEAVAQERFAAATAALAEARRAEQEQVVLAEALSRHDADTADRRERRDEAQRALARAESEAESLAARVAAEEVEVAQGLDGYPSVADRRAALRERSAAAGTLRDALEARVRAAHQLEARLAELATGLAEHGFDSAAQARSALLDAETVGALDAQVSAHAAAWDRVTAALAEPEIAALPEDVVVDVAAAQDVERAARAAADEASGAAQVARERAEAAEAAARDVLAAADAVAARAAEAAPVTRLADLATGNGGDNPRRLSLATYVLMRRFEDVVAAANARLVGMSDGRYELVRSDEKEDVSARRTGLAMRVVDHWTGQQRDPRTLSGGESFYVSLCLALGLADVVTAEAGGIELGTLFVDEGFGSLDPHTLDQVLTELGRLRAGGRVVGVVSHVEALKQSIADRIEVRPTPGGPSRLTVLAGGASAVESTG